MPAGEESDFYIKKEGPAVGILALTKDNQVILTKQFRPGPNEILNELPGGYIDDNETPEQAAKRELLEETGYKGNVKLITNAFDGTYSTMERACVVVTDCEKISDQKLEQNKFAEVVLVSLRQLCKSRPLKKVLHFRDKMSEKINLRSELQNLLFEVILAKNLSFFRASFSF